MNSTKEKAGFADITRIIQQLVYQKITNFVGTNPEGKLVICSIDVKFSSCQRKKMLQSGAIPDAGLGFWWVYV